MSKLLEFNAVKRDTSTNPNQLRSQGIVPGNVFGKKIESISIQCQVKEFKNFFEEVGETGVFNLKIDSKTTLSVVVKNIDLNPVTEDIIHFELHNVDLKTNITATVPLELIGEAPVVASGGLVIQQLSEVEVEALPTDMPEVIEVDQTSLVETTDQITIADLVANASYVILAETTESIATVQEAQAEEEEPIEEVSVDDVEITTEKEDSEEEESAEEKSTE